MVFIWSIKLQHKCLEDNTFLSKGTIQYKIWWKSWRKIFSIFSNKLFLIYIILRKEYFYFLLVFVINLRINITGNRPNKHMKYTNVAPKFIKTLVLL